MVDKGSPAPPNSSEKSQSPPTPQEEDEQARYSTENDFLPARHSDTKGLGSSKVPGLRGRMKSRGKRHTLSTAVSEAHLLPKEEGSQSPPRTRDSSLLTQEQGRAKMIQVWVPHSGTPGVFGDIHTSYVCLRNGEGCGTEEEVNGHQIPAA